MNTSGDWDQSSFQRADSYMVGASEVGNSSTISAHNHTSSNTSHHRVQIQEEIPQDEILDSIASANTSAYNYNREDEIGDDHEDDNGNQSNTHDGEYNLRQQFSNNTDEVFGEDDNDDEVDQEDFNASHLHHNQPSLEQIQRVYYQKGLEELESLQLLDLSPLANWKLSSAKQGFGLKHLMEDSPDLFWQSDGSNGHGNGNNSNGSNGNNGGITNANNELTNPHSITIHFSKKVSIERISIFANFSIDESYTPSKIQILAGSSDGWDLSEVCAVTFSKPIGWSHIIFNGIRGDSVLKCFIIKLVILSNHQDGKDTHIRAIKVFGTKGVSAAHASPTRTPAPLLQHLQRNISIHSDILKDLSTSSGLSNVSGILLNRFRNHHLRDSIEEIQGEDLDLKIKSSEDDTTTNADTTTIDNISEIIGFNSGFQSLELTSVSSIR